MAETTYPTRVPNVRITDRGILFNTKTCRYILNPVRDHVNPYAPYFLAQDIPQSLVELYAETFFGKTAQRLLMRYPDDFPTLENVYYVLQDIDFSQADKRLLVGPSMEEFVLIEPSDDPDRHGTYYINRDGAILQAFLTPPARTFRIISRTYDNDIPIVMLDTSGIHYVHDLLWRTFRDPLDVGNVSEQPFYKDGCTVHTSIDNLAIFSKTEVARMMQSIIQPGRLIASMESSRSRLTEDDYRKICELLLKEPPLSDQAVADLAGVSEATVMGLRKGTLKSGTGMKVRAEYPELAQRKGASSIKLLSEQDVRRIIYLWQWSNYTSEEIARKFNVGPTTVNNICHGMAPAYKVYNEDDLSRHFSMKECRYKQIPKILDKDTQLLIRFEDIPV